MRTRERGETTPTVSWPPSGRAACSACGTCARARSKASRETKESERFPTKETRAKPSSRTGVPSESFLTKELRARRNKKRSVWRRVRTRRLSTRAPLAARRRARGTRARSPSRGRIARMSSRTETEPKKIGSRSAADGGFGGGRVGGGGGAHGERRRRRRRGGGSGRSVRARAGRADVRGGRRGGHRAHGRGQDASHPPGATRARSPRWRAHADSRRVASASPAHAFDADDATIRVWDSGTGAMLFTATHESCGGAVSVLAFSPSGTHLLSLGQDPEGAIRVFSLPSKRTNKNTRRNAGADADEDEDEIGVPPRRWFPWWRSPRGRRWRRGRGSRRTRSSSSARTARRRTGSAALGATTAPPGERRRGFAVARRKRGKGKENDRDSLLRVSVPLRGRTRACARPRARVHGRDRACVWRRKTKKQKTRGGVRGDSRGRVWVRGDDALASVLDADEEPTNAPARRGFVFRMLRGALEGAPLAALPRGEAATTMSAFTDTGGRGVFVGSARRARVLFSEHPLPSPAARTTSTRDTGTSSASSRWTAR